MRLLTLQSAYSTLVQYIRKRKEDDTIQGARIANLNQSFQGEQIVDQGARLCCRSAEGGHFLDVLILNVYCRNYYSCCGHIGGLASR
jgi:hypothetical protein